jgi:hypothetical protein
MRLRITCAAGVCAAPAPKKPTASSTDRSSTSAMFQLTEAVFQHRGLNRRPSHSSQTVVTPAIIPRSV